MLVNTGFQTFITWFIHGFWWIFVGGLHWGRDVCSEGAEGSRHTGGLWDGSGKGHEEGDGEEHVSKEAVEVTCIIPLDLWFDQNIVSI